MISKTKINQRVKNKTNSSLVETIFLAKKSNLELAAYLAKPTRKQIKINIGRLNEAKSDSVIIPGKVLSNGNAHKKIKVYALKFSGKAREKLKKAGCETFEILAALKKGEKLKGEILA
jgi:large subunit ribosomal protein L18e